VSGGLGDTRQLDAPSGNLFVTIVGPDAAAMRSDGAEAVAAAAKADRAAAAATATLPPTTYAAADGERAPGADGLAGAQHMLGRDGAGVTPGERAASAGMRARVLAAAAVAPSPPAPTASGVTRDDPAAQPQQQLPQRAAVAAATVARLEYVRARFGPGALPGGRLRLVAAFPPHACDALLLPQGSAAGAALVVERGGCAYQAKQAAAAAAGAAVVVVVNNEPGLFAMELPATAAADAGLLPALMVTQASGAALRAALSAAAEHGQYAYLEAWGEPLYAGLWQQLAALAPPTQGGAATPSSVNGVSSGWPADPGARRKLYLRLSRSHHPDKASGSADRFEWLTALYRGAGGQPAGVERGEPAGEEGRDGRSPRTEL
jgi:hypothetical protein